MNGNKPIKKFSGGAVIASLWKNQSRNKSGGVMEFYSITLDRRYKDGEAWKSTSSLGVNDLPKAALVLQEAYRYLVLKENGESAGNESVDEETVM